MSLYKTKVKTSFIHKASLLGFLNSRIADTGAAPRHMNIGVFFDEYFTMSFHTAGTDAIWSLPVHLVATNERLLNQLSPFDAMQVGIYLQKQLDKPRFKALHAEIDNLHAVLDR